MTDENGDVSEDSSGSSASPNSHPSMSLVLTELHNRYTDEEDRRKTVETKVGLILTVNAIIISLVGSVSDFGPLLNTIIIAPAVVSAGLGIVILRPRGYARPGEDVDDLVAMATKPEHEFKEQTIFDYKESISTNIERNDDKLTLFKGCFYLTSISLVVFSAGQVITLICQI